MIKNWKRAVFRSKIWGDIKVSSECLVMQIHKFNYYSQGSQSDQHFLNDFRNEFNHMIYLSGKINYPSISQQIIKQKQRHHSTPFYE